jgi:hypothetical protein
MIEAMTISERIKALAPVGASFYRLLTQLSDGRPKLFPIESGLPFRVGDAPTSAPIGKYTVCFYDSGNVLLSMQEDAVQIASPAEVLQSQAPQVAFSFLNASGPSAALSAAAIAPPASVPPATSASALKETASAAATHPDLAAEELEFRRQLHAADMEERAQDFIKNSTYITEIGELFVLNRLMRREMMEMQRTIHQQSQQVYKETAQVKSTILDLLDLQKAVLARATDQLAQPPAAPPDYVGLGHSALAMIREIGVALIQRNAPRDASTALRSGEKQPQLQAHQAEIAKKAPAPAGDVIDKMVNKLKGLSDLDMAMSMSSPGGWKALLDELIAAHPAPPSDATQAAKPDAKAEKSE